MSIEVDLAIVVVVLYNSVIQKKGWNVSLVYPAKSESSLHPEILI